MEIDDLLQCTTDIESSELNILVEAYRTTLSNYQTDPTEANDRHRRAARISLNEMVEELRDKYTQPVEEEPCILSWSEYQETDNQREVYRQLLALGYDVAERTFYRHCKQGKCRPNDNGIFTRRLVKSGYAEAIPLKRAGDDETENPLAARSVKKQELENEKLELANMRDRIRLQREQGNLVEKSTFFFELASRAVVLNNGLEYMFNSHIAELIALVKGEQDRAPEALEFLQRKKNELLNQFANMGEFTVAMELENVQAEEIGEE